MNKSGPRVVLSAYTICVEILLHLASPAVYSLKLVAYTNCVEICFA